MSQNRHDDVSDDDGVIAALPDLQIEVGHLEDLVILRQTDYSGQEDSIAIHRWQVRLLAEHMELLPAAAASPRRDAAAILARRLGKLHQRVDELGRYVMEFVEDEYVKSQLLTACELGDEYLADVDELLQGSPVPPSVRGPLKRALGVIIQPGEDPESVAMDAFRDFLRQNKPLLALAAHWGDDRCGALHQVLMEELLGQPAPPAVAGRAVRRGAVRTEVRAEPATPTKSSPPTASGAQGQLQV